MAGVPTYGELTQPQHSALAALAPVSSVLASIGEAGVQLSTWRTISTTTGTIAEGDNNQGIECTNTAATAITVPAGLGFPFCLVILNSTDDAVSIAASDGVTINSPGSALRVVCKNQPIVLVAKSANVFQAFGPLVA